MYQRHFVGLFQVREQYVWELGSDVEPMIAFGEQTFATVGAIATAITAVCGVIVAIISTRRSLHASLDVRPDPEPAPAPAPDPARHDPPPDALPSQSWGGSPAPKPPPLPARNSQPAPQSWYLRQQPSLGNSWQGGSRQDGVRPGSAVPSATPSLPAEPPPNRWWLVPKSRPNHEGIRARSGRMT